VCREQGTERRRERGNLFDDGRGDPDEHDAAAVQCVAFDLLRRDVEFDDRRADSPGAQGGMQHVGAREALDGVPEQRAGVGAGGDERGEGVDDLRPLGLVGIGRIDVNEEASTPGRRRREGGPISRDSAMAARSSSAW
jgi:hypothetical protein